MKLKLEIKKRWIETLRSGTYLQGVGKLRQESEGKKYYCCLGVLTDICDVENKEKLLYEFNYLPSELYDMVYEDYNPSINENYNPSLISFNENWRNPRVGEYTLAELNDDGKSFSEIADLIEEYL